MFAVTGIGMVSSLGLDAVSSCAAARANLQRITEIDDFLVDDEQGDEIAPVAVHRVPLISAGFFGFARLFQLGAAALGDLLESNNALATAPVGLILISGGETYRRAWLSLARRDADVAAGRDLDSFEAALDTADERIVTRLTQMLIARAGIHVRANARTTTCTTAVGFVAALKQAREWLSQGVCEQCVVGGVDSLLDPTTLEVLYQMGLIKTPGQPTGFIPGEAACFLAIESTRSASARGAAVQAVIEPLESAVGLAHPRLRESAQGHDVLAEVIANSLARTPDGGRSVGHFVVNLNGDPIRANGWGEAAVRTLAPAQLGGAALWIPPLSFGETAAATGPVSVAMLARGWARGYAAAPQALVCLMDDFGGRGAVHVRSAA